MKERTILYFFLCFYRKYTKPNNNSNNNENKELIDLQCSYTSVCRRYNTRTTDVTEHQRDCIVVLIRVAHETEQTNELREKDGSIGNLYKHL